MSNLSDKEIDRLSREAADSFEPDPSPLSWSRLEQKLTEQMPERPPDGFRFGRINPYVWGPALVLVAGVSFFFIKNIIYSQHSTLTKLPVSKILPPSPENSDRKNEIVHGTAANAATSTKKENGGNSSIVSDKDHPAATDKDNSSTGDKNGIVSSGKNKADYSDGIHGVSSDKDNVGATRSSIRVSPKNGSPDKNGNHSVPEEQDVAAIRLQTKRSSGSGRMKSGISHDTRANQNHSALISTRNNTDASRATPNADGSNNNSANLGNSANLPQGSKDIDATPKARTGWGLPLVAISGTGLGKISGNDSLMNKLARSSGPAPHKTMHVNRSLNFGLSFGPDYTDGGGITNDQIGNNIGVTVGYYLTNKLSVNTGILYSNKFFWSPGHGTPSQVSNFIATGWARTNAASPPIEFVNGAANIYELPLTLRYDFAKSEKTKFFVNAGFSSYFILKQTYINFFHSAGRPAAIKIVDDEQQNYWFGVSDLSFGFETEIGKGFSFQAEPYFRFPLRNMGMENLKLDSYGFMLSFRYTPVLSRSKR
jgi:hypothetical protein